MRLLYITFICCIVCTIPALAQADAGKTYLKAMEYMAKKNKPEAYKTMQQAIRENPASPDAYSALGEWYFKDHKFKEAADIFLQASRNCPNGNKAFALPLAKSLLHSYSPEQALQLVAAYGTLKEKSQWVLLREQAYFMKQALRSKVVDTVYNMGLRINSPQADMFPFITADTQNLFFTRRFNDVDEDFYTARTDSCGGWFKAKNMGSPPNSKQSESAQSISGDGHYLFFMKCDNRSETGWDQGGCDLFMAYTADSVWSVPENFGGTINTPGYEGMPSLSSDNRELYFVSNREGGYGGLDIWMSEFKNGLWQAPRNLGAQINTAGNETAPFIHVDNNTLYFVSDAQAGMGGQDIYLSRRVDDTTWNKAQNLGYPINTCYDENSFNLTIDGTTGYFASDRDSAAGNFDIYEVRMPANISPIPVALIKGVVYDSLSNEALTIASIYINDPKTGEPAYHYTSNRGDGSYMITLPAGYSYTYTADRIGYMANTGIIDLTGKKNIEQINYSIPLLPNGYQKPVRDSLIATILFPINSKKMTDSGKAILQAAIDPWLQETNCTIIISGYTDNSGNPMLNEELSYLRANLVRDELVSMGIEHGTIDAKGWGEANPVAPNDTEENRNLNRRVEVVIRR
ncbi:hypothetical protein CAP35_05980 [Chitinophagaceae bacterium IBVUCB1]|nr:hypothetical protein CAP35_05980 [Chitinophagaceae bacterium IBVUCB1]